MTVGAGEGWAQVWSEFHGLWDDLSPEEQSAYWKNAGKYAYDMPQRSAQHTQLCLALHEIESGKSVKRVSGSIPIKVRPRSADELKRAVGQHKAQLLDAGRAQHFLVNAACNWIQFSFTAALNDMLDAVGCKRNEVGTRKGPIPTFSADDASRDALRLAAIHGTRQMTLVCAGLIVSDLGWRGLDLARKSLKQAPVVEPSASPLPTEVMCSMPDGVVVCATEPPSVTRPDSEKVSFPPVDETSLQALEADLGILGALLGGVTATTSAKEVPDLNPVIELWEQIQVRHAALAAQLNVGTSRLTDLTEALAVRNRNESYFGQLVRCRAIRHVSEPDFTTIRQKCDELQEVFRSGQHLPEAELAVRSLLRLVDEGDHLGDELAADLQFEIEAVFGRAVASAAVRGKLVAGSPALEEAISDNSSKLSSSSVTEALSEARGGELDPMPPAEAIAGESTVSEGSLPHEPSVPDTPGQPDASSSVAEPTTALASLEGATAVMDAPAEIYVAQSDISPSPIDELPQELAVAVDFELFDDFCRAHWVDASGEVVLAPWRATGFAKEIASRALQTWQLGDAGLAYLFARAAEAAGAAAPLQLDDLAQADELLSAPESPTAGRQPERVERLRRTLMLGADIEDPSVGIGLMLEALKPTLPCTLTPSEIESMLKQASFHDSGIDDIVRFLLIGWTSQIDPLESLRRRLLDERPEPFEKLEGALRKAQEALKRDVTALWSAAGGKIQRTHCRAAWTRFVQEHVAPLRDDLAPNGPKGVAIPRLQASSIGSRVVNVGRAFARIMDNEGVKHQDRSAADGAAQQIVAAISHVADALLAVETRRQQEKSRASYDGVPVEAGMRLLAGVSSSTTDRLCASLFSAVLERRPRADALRLSARHLLSHVDVIRFLDPGALVRDGIARSGVRVLDVEDPRAASVLLQGGATGDGEVPDNDREFLAALRDAAAEDTRRDVLAALSQTDVLWDHQRTLLHQYAFDLAADTFEATQRLEALWSACDELMAPNEAMLKVVIDEAKEMTQPERGTGVSMNKRLLRLTWLARSVELAERQRDSAVDALVIQARTNSPELAERVLRDFQAEDYRAGFSLVHGGVVPAVEPGRLGGRRTIWRDDALVLWPEPRTKLAEDLRGSTEEQQRLVDIWSASATESGQRDALPKLLFAVISGETDRSRSDRRPVKLSDLREHQTRRTVVDCEAIRTYFQKTGMNPTFLPQLADYGKIVIMPLPPTGVRGGGVPSDWATAATSDEATSALYAFLAPGIALSRRDELCADLRKRGITAAVIDDIDVCRLCAASAGDQPESFVPFLEILLEQIDLARASPFSSLDGQHVRLETYVGREQEARKIALGAEYTRLFSGRKLGKSALLKYVVDRFDNGKLDSENTLNVFFITIAGGDSEPWVVDAILEAMIKRFRLHERPEARGLEAASRFMDYMNHFLSERPGQSILLILDEADAFVEKQLARNNMARDNSDREGSLSFRMMKQLPAHDSKGLPLIRTLFSGYRTTNTRGGVWANAGDVLVLPPLEDDEAVKFLQGMLARVGISLGSHAPFVAMRCGFQPAVLIRFGESLVRATLK